MLDGQPFRTSKLGVRLREARAHDATAILETSPTALLFGVWNSTGEGGGLGAKFARAIVSEIIGVEAVAGKRTGSRIDPLGILKSVEVFKTEANDWDVTEAKAGKKAKKVRPSEINHRQHRALRLGAWRHLRLCRTDLRDHARGAAAAALWRTTGTGQRSPRLSRGARLARPRRSRRARLRPSFALRSRLRRSGPVELIAFDGTARVLDLDLDAATS